MKSNSLDLYQFCDHFWEYIKGTKNGVEAICTKCKEKRLFTWFEWKSMLNQSRFLGTTNFK